MACPHIRDAARERTSERRPTSTTKTTTTGASSSSSRARGEGGSGRQSTNNQIGGHFGKKRISLWQQLITVSHMAAAGQVPANSLPIPLSTSYYLSIYTRLRFE
jgi:hypothetical protein